MKGYRRAYPLFSLCGLNCGLCPIHHMDKGCPGCGGGEGHQSCPIVRCSQRHESVEYCYQCEEYPCEKYAGITDYDSFLSHQNMRKDFEKARRIGLNAYQSQLNQRIEILEELLRCYNDGRRKSLFCTAANLLELPDLQAVMEQIEGKADLETSRKENAALAARYIQTLAEQRSISLKLRKKPKTN